MPTTTSSRLVGAAMSAAGTKGRPPTLTSRERKTYRDDHGTPEWILDLHRSLFGNRIDLDLASSAKANETVHADRFHSKEDPCPDSPNVCALDFIWCNPPGPGKNVIKFWDIWLRCVEEKFADGSFLLFSIDHFRMLRPPLGIVLHVGFLRHRVAYVGQRSSLSIGSALITTRVPAPLCREVGTWLEWWPL